MAFTKLVAVLLLASAVLANEAEKSTHTAVAADTKEEDQKLEASNYYGGPGAGAQYGGLGHSSGLGSYGQSGIGQFAGVAGHGASTYGDSSYTYPTATSYTHQTFGYNEHGGVEGYGHTPAYPSHGHYRFIPLYGAKTAHYNSYAPMYNSHGSSYYPNKGYSGAYSSYQRPVYASYGTEYGTVGIDYGHGSGVYNQGYEGSSYVQDHSVPVATYGGYRGSHYDIYDDKY